MDLNWIIVAALDAVALINQGNIKNCKFVM
jgi:hypothetical protein